VRDVGAPDAFQRQHRERRRDDQRHRYARTRRYLPGCAALALETCVEPASEVARRLDRPRGLQREHATPHGGVVPSATGTAYEVAFETVQLARGGDQAVTKIRIPFEEFSARHRENLLPSGQHWVPGPPPNARPLARARGRGVGHRGD